mmetsp:Transcript_17962/g.45636  ORF Transcript_17962/g.45636 Transcript_17962/m.45636 type:complete len:292 (+) Transcript_17962:496-1371(+)
MSAIAAFSNKHQTVAFELSQTTHCHVVGRRADEEQRAVRMALQNLFVALLDLSAVLFGHGRVERQLRVVIVGHNVRFPALCELSRPLSVAGPDLDQRRQSRDGAHRFLRPLYAPKAHQIILACICELCGDPKQKLLCFAVQGLLQLVHLHVEALSVDVTALEALLDKKHAVAGLCAKVHELLLALLALLQTLAEALVAEWIFNNVRLGSILRRRAGLLTRWGIRDIVRRCLGQHNAGIEPVRVVLSKEGCHKACPDAMADSPTSTSGTGQRGSAKARAKPRASGSASSAPN